MRITNLQVYSHKGRNYHFSVNGTTITVAVITNSQEPIGDNSTLGNILEKITQRVGMALDQVNFALLERPQGASDGFHYFYRLRTRVENGKVVVHGRDSDILPRQLHKAFAVLFPNHPAP